MVNEENIIYVMIGLSLFTTVFTLIAIMFAMDMKDAEDAREKSRIEELGKRKFSHRYHR